jgi:hypothetical protein
MSTGLSPGTASKPLTLDKAGEALRWTGEPEREAFSSAIVQVFVRAGVGMGFWE